MAGNLSYDVFVNEPPPQDGQLRRGSVERAAASVSYLSLLCDMRAD